MPTISFVKNRVKLNLLFENSCLQAQYDNDELMQCVRQATSVLTQPKPNDDDDVAAFCTMIKHTSSAISQPQTPDD